MAACFCSPGRPCETHHDYQRSAPRLMGTGRCNPTLLGMDDPLALPSGVSSGDIDPVAGGHPGRNGALRLPVFVFLVLLMLGSPWRSGESGLFATFAHASSLPPAPRHVADRQVVAAAKAPVPPALLRVIQVYPPVRFEQTDDNKDQSSYPEQLPTSNCQQTLLTYSFANSYGAPYVGPYTPPDCRFNRVVWNLTVVAAGRQFDRLGTVSLGAIEVFRTSTAEPTKQGIVWTYLKDVSSFNTLHKQKQTLIFDLGNIVNNVYTAPLNVTLTAVYYNVDSDNHAADLILPLSKGLNNASSAFTFPAQNVTSSLSVPRNSVKAIFTVAATGQSDEEFWWSNVLQQDVNDFPSSGALPGYSPFREVQLFIDGTLAGVVWPFPIIFTGGIVPGFWRPIVGIDAYDLKEDEIDVTPWLPLLCDGKEHEFSIKVSGLVRTANGTTVLSETVGSYWIVTGKLFLWLDSSSAHQTTGSPPTLSFPPPSIQGTSRFQNNTNSNDTSLDYKVNVARQLSVSGSIRTSAGEQKVSWQQSLTYSSVGRYSQGGNLQYNALQISGQDTSSSGYSRTISYPLNTTSLYTTQGDNNSITASISRGKEVKIFGPSVFPTGLESFSSVPKNSPNIGSLLSTTQDGLASYTANTTSGTSFSSGQTSQELTFSAVNPVGAYGAPAGTTELYRRKVLAVNGTIIQDEGSEENQSMQPASSSSAAGDLQIFAVVRSKKNDPFGRKR